MLEMIEISREDVRLLTSIDMDIIMTILKKENCPTNFKHLYLAGIYRQYLLLDLDKADLDLRLHYKQHYKGLHFNVCQPCPYYKYAGCKGVETFLADKCVNNSRKENLVYEKTIGNEDEILSVHIPEHMFSLYLGIRPTANCFIKAGKSLVPAGIGNVDGSDGSVCYGDAFTEFYGDVFRAYYTFLSLERNGDLLHGASYLKTISENIKSWTVEKYEKNYSYLFTLNNLYPNRLEISLESDIVLINNDNLAYSLKTSSENKSFLTKISKLIENVPDEYSLNGKRQSLLKIVD
jgi:hypothetical protein